MNQNETGWIGYDTETTGLHRHKPDFRIFAHSEGDADGETRVYRMDNQATPRERGAARNRLRKIWSPEWQNIAKVAHNAKFDIGGTQVELNDRTLVSKHRFHDTLAQASIVMNDSPSYELKYLAWVLGGIPRDDEKKIKEFLRGKKDRNYSHVPREWMEVYQHADALRVAFLHQFFYPKIQANAKWNECYEEELKLIETTIRMEDRGMMIHRENCFKLQGELKTKANTALYEAARILGRRVDLGNDNIIRKILFSDLKMPPVSINKKSGEPSTQKKDLFDLKHTNPHPILDLILQYRSYGSGVTTIQSYLDHADETDVIHPSMRTNGARTGRQSCSDPNLQNAQKGAGAASVNNPYPVPARTCFRPRPGYVNFHIDYAGIELRLLVEYSGDRILVDEIAKGDKGDVHSLAAEVFYPGLTEEEIKKYGSYIDPLIAIGFAGLEKDKKKILRGSAKNANFAIPYGANVVKLAATLGIPVELALRLFNNYREKFPKLVSLSKDISAEVQQYGYVETRFGRRLFVPRMKAYAGTNYKIQGTAAEILKRGQNRVSPLLERETGGECQILLTIHDELIIECPVKMLSHFPPVLRKVRTALTDFGTTFNVPLDVETDIVFANWAEKRKYCA